MGPGDQRPPVRGVGHPALRGPAQDRGRGRGRVRDIPLAGLHQDRDKQVESFICKGTKTETEIAGVGAALSTSGMW